jgi:TolB-like protein
VAVAVLLAGAFWLAPGMMPVAGLVSRAQHVSTLAILPLVNLSGDVQQDFLADGMTEALIADLSRLPGVKVISRTSVMQYKLMRKPMREIARELHADVLLEGALMLEGEKVRITTTLVRGTDERNLWTESHNGRVGELFDLQRRVGLAVAREIGARSRSRSAPRSAPVKEQSQVSYLKGASYAGQWRLDDAIASFRKSIEVDSTNAAAHASLARAYYFRAFFGEVSSQEAFSQMRDGARAALALDPELGEAYGVMALVNTHFDYDWASAEKNFAKALALSPSNAQVHHDYAHFLLAMGRGPESVEESRRSLGLDPANSMLTSCLGWHSLFRQRFDESLQHAAEAQRMMPSFWALIVQGWAESGKGFRTEAVQSMRDAVILAPDLGLTQGALANALAKNGQTREARAILAHMVAQSRDGYIPAYDLALVYAGLGENDNAFEWLAKAIAERSVFVVHLTWDARLQPLHSDRRFGELIARLAIPGGTAPAKSSKAMGSL